MEDPPLAEPESDVVGALGRPEEDEVAGLQVALLERFRRRLLLVRVPRDESPEPPVGHVHEPGAVDPALGQAAPLVGRLEVRTGLLDRVACARQPRPLAVGLAAQRVLADPARVAVRGADPCPAVLDRFDRQRLAGKRLGHLLGALVRIGAHGRDLGDADS